MTGTTLHIVSLGCARNDVDSEELAASLTAAGFAWVDEPDRAEVVVVNTCGFIDQAKRDSIEQLLAAVDVPGSSVTRAVIAAGCLAERYGADLAESLPEIAGVIGFDQYPEIATAVRRAQAGQPIPAHEPRDRRRLARTRGGPPGSAAPRMSPASPSPGVVAGEPQSPTSPGALVGVSDSPLGHGAGGAGVASVAGSRSPAAWSSGQGAGLQGTAPPGSDDPWLTVAESVPARPASGPPVPRRRLDDGPSAPLKIASGCDRRCSFCAIPAFRGAFRSRPPDALVAEAGWLAAHGVKELCLVSENTTSYGKDWGDHAALPRLLGRLADVDGLEWIRLSYLQPDELRPELIAAVADTPKVVPYFDLSFQHVSARLLRRMRRFGNADSFLDLIASIRSRRPDAGLRSNVIVGFPGETEADIALLTDFLAAAQLDAIGVFGYSDEEGTAAYGLDGHLDQAEIAARVDAVADLADVVMAERARRWVGAVVDVLVEGEAEDGWVGRIPQQGPEVDGEIEVERAVGETGRLLGRGNMVRVRVRDSVGVDLIGVPEWRGAGHQVHEPG